MKKRLLTITLLLAALILASSCSKNKLPDEVDNMRQMAVPQDFNFENTQTLDLRVKLPPTVDYSERLKRIWVYDDSPDNGGTVIQSGVANHDGIFSASVQTSNFTDTLYIHSFAGWLSLPVSQGMKGLSDEYEADYGTNYSTQPPDTTPDGLPGQAGGFHWGSKLKAGDNYIVNGDFESDDFGKQNHWNSARPNDTRWYLTNSLRTLASAYQDGNNQVVRTVGDNRTRYGGLSQYIAVEPGEEVVFTADIRKTNGNAKVWLYLIPRRTNNQALKYFSYSYNNPSSNWTSKTITATMPANTAYVQVLFWSHNYRNSIMDYDDAVVSISGRVVDADGDGVEDDEDAYPNDANKATNNYYPGEGQYGTLAYEDMWPVAGDYDFNDLVLGYLFNHIKNADNLITSLGITFQLRAIGASIQNGFGLQFDITNDKISQVTSSYEITADNLSFDAKGLESGQNLATVIVFEDAFNILSHDGGGLGINTDPDRAYVEPVNITLSIDFSEGLTIQELGNAPNNPFMFRTNDRGQEIHLPGYPPTIKADQSKFQTGDDATNVNNGYYYKTVRGLPWGMNLPTTFIYPIEKMPIIMGHLKFQQWAISGGYSFMDWYQPVEGYRNNTRLYVRN